MALFRGTVPALLLGLSPDWDGPHNSLTMLTFSQRDADMTTKKISLLEQCKSLDCLESKG